MKTLTEITNIIANQIGEVAKSVSEDYSIIVCPERIFADDYIRERDEYINTNSDEIPSLNEEEPNFTYFSKTIFFVIKVGSGQANMAVKNSEVTIQALSEENDFVVARQILDEFVAKFNFKYKDGISQGYFTPSMSASQESVYTGFRALLSINGFVRVPEDGFIFVNQVVAGIVEGSEEIEYNVPFIECNYNYSGQPDPQAFAGSKGSTVALIRQSTETVSISTYLAYKGDSSAQDAFTKAILGAKENMNRKFKISLKTIIDDLPIVSDYFVLASASYSQELADLATWTLTFARAKREE